MKEEILSREMFLSKSFKTNVSDNKKAASKGETKQMVTRIVIINGRYILSNCRQHIFWQVWAFIYVILPTMKKCLYLNILMTFILYVMYYLSFVPYLLHLLKSIFKVSVMVSAMFVDMEHILIIVAKITQKIFY